jgi:hypothetical protein
MVCIDCNIDKDEKHFRKYTNPNGSLIQRRQCYSCLAVRQKAREGKIAQPRAYIKEPEVLEVAGVTKKCEECKQVLAVAYFYKSSLGSPFKNCKKCHVRLTQEKVVANKVESGGSTRVPPKCNIFADETQKSQTHQFLKLCGWSYTNGVWWKKGIKTAENKWERFVEVDKPKRTGHKKGGRKILAIHQQVEQIIKDYEKDINFFELAHIYKCSHTSIRKLIRDYYDEKRAN